MGRLARIPLEYKLERTEVKSSDSMVLAQWKEKIISIHQYTQCERTEVKSSDLALHVYQGDSMDFYSYSSQVVKNHSAF